MADLTACYFCGTIDGPLEEYPAIPEELDPPAEIQRTVVVCPACREKLAAVHEPIVDHVDTSGTTSSGEGESMDDTPSRARVDVDPEPGSEPDPATDADSSPPGTDSSQVTEADDEPREFPPEARQIVRLLQNREFPVERADIETVAANAYDLDRKQCREAIDALVEGGVLVEDEEMLDRPSDDE